MLRDKYILKPIKYVLSEFLWLFSIFLFVLIRVFSKPKQVVPQFRLKDRINDFNHTQNPDYFIHLTDIHVNELKPDNNLNYQLALNYNTNLKAKTIVITGDICDNWGKNIIWKYGRQYPPDHEVYSNLTKGTAPYLTAFIDQIGNHDEFGVESYDSPSHHFLNYSYFFKNQKNVSLDDFLVSCFFIEENAFIILNPVRFPSPHAVLDFWAHPSTQMLDRIESSIKTASNSSRVFVINHYPATLWTNESVSSKGKTFREILSESNTTMFLSGHTHPTVGIPQHHGKVLEIVGSDLVKHKGVGIVSYDNGNSIHHTISNGMDTPFIITHPPPKNQLNMHSYRTSNTFPIRVLVFNNSITNVTFDGDLKGDIYFQRFIKPGVGIYEANVTLAEGLHRIVVNCQDNLQHLDFVIGENSLEMTEYLENFDNLYGTATRALPFVWIILFIILFPIKFETYSSKLTFYVSSANNWVFNDDNSIISWFLNSIFGVFVIRWRLFSVATWYRIILFVAVILPLLPITFISIESKFGFIHIFGYFITSRLYPEIWGQILSLIFLLFILTPVVFMSSMFVLYSRSQWSNYLIIPIIGAFLGIIICVAFANTLLTEAVGTLLANTSPAFFLAPIGLYISLFYWRKSLPSNIDNADPSSFFG